VDARLLSAWYGVARQGSFFVVGRLEEELGAKSETGAPVLTEDSMRDVLSALLNLGINETLRKKL